MFIQIFPTEAMENRSELFDQSNISLTMHNIFLKWLKRSASGLCLWQETRKVSLKFPFQVSILSLPSLVGQRGRSNNEVNICSGRGSKHQRFQVISFWVAEVLLTSHIFVHQILNFPWFSFRKSCKDGSKFSFPWMTLWFSVILFFPMTSCLGSHYSCACLFSSPYLLQHIVCVH